MRFKVKKENGKWIVWDKQKNKIVMICETRGEAEYYASYLEGKNFRIKF